MVASKDKIYKRNLFISKNNGNSPVLNSTEKYSRIVQPVYILFKMSQSLCFITIRRNRFIILP